MPPYGTLAEVYDFLVHEALLSPEGSAAAFAGVVEGERVLDCACGTGTLAVGLALRGFAVSASDASPPMVARTRALAEARGVDVRAQVRRWEALEGGPYDTVLCVGNSLTHAADRRAALAGMRRVAREGARVGITSRTWERPQAGGEEVVERGGRQATVRRTWGDGVLDIEVTVDGAVHAERLEFWPFTHEELDADLRAAGWVPEDSTWDPSLDRYLVTARAGGRAGSPRAHAPRDRGAP